MYKALKNTSQRRIACVVYIRQTNKIPWKNTHCKHQCLPIEDSCCNTIQGACCQDFPRVHLLLTAAQTLAERGAARLNMCLRSDDKYTAQHWNAEQTSGFGRETSYPLPTFGPSPQTLLLWLSETHSIPPREK